MTDIFVDCTMLLQSQDDKHLLKVQDLDLDFDLDLVLDLELQFPNSMEF